jgi:hypothetical protein
MGVLIYQLKSQPKQHQPRTDAYYARYDGDVNFDDYKGAIIVGKKDLQETNTNKRATDEYISILKDGVIKTHLYAKTVWQLYKAGDTIGVSKGVNNSYNDYLWEQELKNATIGYN